MFCLGVAKRMAQNRFYTNGYNGIIKSCIIGAQCNITLNRAQQGNYLSLPDILDFNQQLNIIEQDPQVKAVFIKSTSKRIFCSGIDFKEYENNGIDYARKHITASYELISNLAQFNKPMLCYFNGTLKNIALGFLFASHGSYSDSLDLHLNEEGQNII